jgi:hypothetical protein
MTGYDNWKLNEGPAARDAHDAACNYCEAGLVEDEDGAMVRCEDCGGYGATASECDGHGCEACPPCNEGCCAY